MASLPGHAGITFSFRVVCSPAIPSEFVFKLTPLGVSQRRETDVVYQVPVLKRMALAAVRIPEVVAFGGCRRRRFSPSPI